MTYSLFLKTLFGMKAPHKQGVDTVRSGLLNMSEQKENVGADFLAHMFWVVLYNSCRHVSNPFSPEATQSRYMDPDSVHIPVTILGHMDERLACKYPLMSGSFPIQWFGRGETAAAGYQSVVPISK